MEINAKNIEICYGNHKVVEDIDINLYKGLITTIIGPNGSGKSTVLKALTRLLKHSNGVIELDKKNINSFKQKDFSKIIGVLPQRHSAPPDFKVHELVSYGRMPYQKAFSKNSDEDDKIVKWAMKSTGVYHLKEKTISEISGGEFQRMWIATVLAQKPEILFLDEPTTYLDISHQIDTMKLVKKLNKDFGMGIVMVLHDLVHALEVSDRIIVIKDGKKYSEGTPEEIITAKMMKDVYDVDCDIVKVSGRKKPLIMFKEIVY